MTGFQFPASPVAVTLLLASCCSLLLPATTAASEPALPEAWRSAWERPGAAYRPLQIIHGIPKNRSSPAGLRHYQNLGLGGVVANVAFTNYLQSEENWQRLAAAIEACRQLDLIVWIYDEEGYPSGAAGGQVLMDNRGFEALALTKDTGRPELFRLRPAYEYTHASNNFHAARRYINLLDEQAVATFLAKTHEAYWARLAPHFGRTIQAFFTDEPSLMAVNIGALPDTVRNRVRVDDRPDPAVKPLPSAPGPTTWQSNIDSVMVKTCSSDDGVSSRANVSKIAASAASSGPSLPTSWPSGISAGFRPGAAGTVLHPRAILSPKNRSCSMCRWMAIS
jgi:hypothetical protein